MTNKLHRPTTLGEFIVEKQSEFPYASGELSQLFTSIRLAEKVVNREINKAGLADILGAIGAENVQGENQMKLDVFDSEGRFLFKIGDRDFVNKKVSAKDKKAAMDYFRKFWPRLCSSR